ncbi:hypothetical protein DCAR_0103176 [Daucus carota subsp. sativus]|uniref:Pentacotripeptide-repeat region of PRORP domain-containing protein n=1 Tax=Daucus carota subsp. sativus TaxID=79200 RepID=A0AAF0W6N0_DAUCS|nr:hypothetical protein DCAR_0103176 [Daucus carota subsp. sativus]
MLIAKNITSLVPRHPSLKTRKPHFSSNTKQIWIDKLLTLITHCVSVTTLQQLHTQLLVSSIYKPNHLLSKIIDLKDFNYSSKLFSQIPHPNDYSFNVIIRGFTTTWKKYDLCLSFYYKMKSLGLLPNNFTYPFLFIACGNLLVVDHGRLGHSMVWKLGLVVDGHVRHSLITMYSKCGQVGCAREVFEEITDRDLVSWNSMISGYSKMGFARDAVSLFGRMRDEGFQPDEMSVVSVLVACGDLGDLSCGKLIEGFVTESEINLNSYVGSALINMYGKCGDLVSARSIFDRMKQKDVVIWNAMITGQVSFSKNIRSNNRNFMAESLISLFKSMIEAGVSTDRITLIGLLSACATIGLLDVGNWVKAYASEIGLLSDVYISTALIDMYAKCGSVEQACTVFENMPQKNTASWNAMISAFAFHGKAQKALALFERMCKEDTAACPDDITFVGVLSACVHAGLVNEGRQFFDLMGSSFGLVPRVEHYSCMVDLLARAGLVYEAWDFIVKMPEKPDEITLGALLGACHKVGNADVGERVIQILLETEPSNSGNYVISSKIYANSKRWDDAAKMRLLMRERAVTKVPGYSCIEICTRIHEFYSGDSSHVDSEYIYQVLGMLYEEMKMES